MQLKFFNLPVDIRQRIYNINNKEKEQSIKLRNVYFKKLLANEMGAVFEEIYRTMRSIVEDEEEDIEIDIEMDINTIINQMDVFFGSVIVGYIKGTKIDRGFNRFQYALNLLEFDREWYKKYEKMLDTINGGSNLINWNCMKEVNQIRDILAPNWNRPTYYSDSDSDSD